MLSNESIVLYVLILYFFIGFLFVPFILLKLNHKDKEASITNWKVKFLFLPGFVLVWPFLIYSWSIKQGNKSPDNSIRTHLVYWIIMAIVLPVMILMGLYYRPESPVFPKVKIQLPQNIIHQKQTKDYKIRVAETDSHYLVEIQPLETILRPDQSVYISMNHQKKYIGKINGLEKTVFELEKMGDLSRAVISIQDLINNHQITQIEL